MAPLRRDKNGSISALVNPDLLEMQAAHSGRSKMSVAMSATFAGVAGPPRAVAPDNRSTLGNAWGGSTDLRRSTNTCATHA
jgi:hypothetical protein